MEGITALNMYNIGGFDLALQIALTILLLVCVAYVVLLIRARNTNIPIYILCAIFIAGAVVGCIFNGLSEETTRYEVLIDDTVSYIEFTKQYEVISKEGLIYTITLKEGSKPLTVATEIPYKEIIIDPNEWYDNNKGE